MSQIRVLVRDVWYTLQTTNLGTIRIAARIVAALARDTARMVPGVRVALGRSTNSKLAAPSRARHLPAPPSARRRRRARPHRSRRPRRRGHLRDPVHEVAREIQQHVIATLRDNIGLQAVAVNVTVDDVLTDDDQ